MTQQRSRVMEERMTGDLPVVAVALGDPSGISPELTARILAEADLRAAARYVVFGDARLLQQGIADSGVDPQVRVVRDGEALPLGERPVFVDLANHDPADLQRGKATPRAPVRRRRPGRCGLLHALQQGGDALRLSRL